ncbi:pyridoxamine 5'-phosphate oxidase family protein [Curvibacter sp. HBC28]|uniref:Pyridoxamine 5'-phosphate oxidase family protein n=1 Tax=Curvibacter microcysteis TaxID=3026419 RepID=A0ABT5M8W3_9BURK|nr:pyridoxamine 5'-phosphate oxidase family protein [Curvibacter sp. HBC28]MDD0813028.1 pyridoxamine 5'-phosphate oxidase family protein [Curvibacter sp. HBC28]
MTHESRLDLALRRLLTERRVAALGTCTDAGAPFVSQVPYAIDHQQPALVILVSGLAAHAAHLAARPEASLLIAEPEQAGEPVHGLARVSLQLQADWPAADSPEANRARQVYLDRFPEAEPLTKMADFRWVRFHPLAARHVGGLGAARSLDGEDLRALLQTAGDAGLALVPAEPEPAATDVQPPPEPEPPSGNWVQCHAELLAQGRPPATGSPVSGLVTLLHLGAQGSQVIFGDGREAAQVLPWPVGVEALAKTFFRHDPPRPIELEEAIATVEDALMRLVPRLPVGSRLHALAHDPGWAQIAELAGASGPLLSLEAVERVFNRLCLVAEGRPASLEGWPGGRGLAARLLVLREFMHHLAFDAVVYWLPDGRHASLGGAQDPHVQEVRSGPCAPSA